MILLSAQRMPVAKIADVTFTSADRVRDVIHNFNRDGFASLYPKYKGGRPKTFTLPERREIKKIAKSTPTEHDLPFSTWSLSKLADFLVAEGVVDDISHEGLRVLLREEGVSFQKVKTWKASRGNFGQTNYSGAKSGIVGMVRTWAMELQRAGITANAVCPVAATAMTETVPFLAPYIEGMKNGEPLPDIIRREVGLGTPEDAAGIISFLASDAAAEITGQAFAVGGDRLALWSHPDLTAVEYHDGGWSADDIAAQWNGTFGDTVQSVGEEFPEELMAK